MAALVPSPSPNARPVSPDYKPTPAPKPTFTVIPPSKTQQAEDDRVAKLAPRTLGAYEIALTAQKAGFKGDALVVAVAVAEAESSGRTDATGPVVPDIPANDWIGAVRSAMGLWQIMPAAAQSGAAYTGSAYDRVLDQSVSGVRDSRLLFDPDFNARSAYAISKGGTNWKPWSTYTSGAYLTHMADARAAVQSIGAAPVDGNPSASTSGEPFVDVTWSDGALIGVHLGGTARGTDFGAKVVGGSIDQSVKQPSELTLEIHDATLGYLTSSKLKRGVRLQVNRQRFTVTAVEISDGGAGAHLTVQAMPTGIVSLMHTDPPTVTGMPAGDYVGLLARAVGVSYMPASGKGVATGAGDAGQGATEPQDVKANPTDDVLSVLNPYRPTPPAGQRRENAWEVVQRLNTANGYECWEDARGLYWGPATSSMFAPALYVSWRGQPATSPSGAVRALQVPSVSFSTPGRGRYARVSGSFQIAAADAGRVVLGQRVDMALGALLVARPDVTDPRGILGSNAPAVHSPTGGPATTQAADGITDTGQLRVTRIHRDLGRLEQPLTVEFESAVNLIGTDAPDPAMKAPVGLPVPALLDGTVNPYSSDVAVATARKASRGTCVPNSCMHTVGNWYGYQSSGWERAIDGWNGTPDRYKHPDDPNPPAGALCYWAGGAAGHVAMSIGDGTVISTDAPQIGRVGDPLPLAWFSAHWRGKRYLGWCSPYFPHGVPY
ncbi:transglycosylase SLT domain-containing protein [Motilibacter peucedani]|uniref:transglycosylase SLT domain-containing protein n=1 Tax=Motilibacter peucedani TaxID=598650 RepID=UPI000EB44D6E|nr:transglycosylase SLT domain-containing protein [Motilibacter peucedani]